MSLRIASPPNLKKRNRASRPLAYDPRLWGGWYMAALHADCMTAPAFTARWPSANSGCVKIASAISVANERLLDRVRHFVEPRLAILAFE